LKKDQKYVILRFVSWQANHDIGHSGIDDNIKIFLINSLERKYRVFISSEAEVTDFRLKKYLIKIPPELMHDALFYADFFITESGTMASEAAILNTPVIYVNSLPLMGYLIDEERNGMLFHYKTADGVLDKIEEFMVFKDIKKTFKKANSKLLEGMINPTSFLCWFIEEYPDSFSEMKKNPDFQLRFM
jgi:predicted glycosyltransferase